jgi:hypothetical protein
MLNMAYVILAFILLLLVIRRNSKQNKVNHMLIIYIHHTNILF